MKHGLTTKDKHIGWKKKTKKQKTLGKKKRQKIKCKEIYNQIKTH